MFGHDDHNDDQQNNTNLPAVSDDNNGSNGSMPVADGTLDSSSNDNPSEAGGPPATSPTLGSTPRDGGDNQDELLTVKQQVLQDLHPLVNHLDQSPEEKFKTIMMMIQASDDRSLVQAAYDAAKQISDEKARAQALLDVVNEINYFTQPHNEG